MRYRKKPLVVEGFCYGVDNLPEWFLDKVLSDEIQIFCDHCNIKFNEFVMRAHKYDYVIQGIEKEIYVIPKKVFLKSYEILEDRSIETEPTKKEKRALNMMIKVGYRANKNKKTQ
jgi:hypothetical protein